MTRGTFTAPECTQLDRSIAHTDSYCAPSQALLPLLTKWMLVFDDPATQTLWLGKAVPRVWLSPGERVSVQRAPTRYGRVSLTMEAAVSMVDVNVTLPEGFTWPTGGLLVRLRLPDQQRIASVAVGGQSWPHFDAANETVAFAPRSATAAELQSILVHIGQAQRPAKFDDVPPPGPFPNDCACDAFCAGECSYNTSAPGR